MANAVELFKGYSSSSTILVECCLQIIIEHIVNFIFKILRMSNIGRAC